MTRYDWLFLASPAITILVSVPMLLGLVPPNGVYGFRTQASMASPEVWYASNRLAAQYLIAVSMVSAGLYYAGKHFVSAPKTQVLAGTMAFTILLLVAVGAVQVKAGKLARQRGLVSGSRSG